MGRESGIVRNLFPTAQPFPYDLPFCKKFLSAPRDLWIMSGGFKLVTDTKP